MATQTKPRKRAVSLKGYRLRITIGRRVQTYAYIRERNDDSGWCRLVRLDTGGGLHLLPDSLQLSGPERV